MAKKVTPELARIAASPGHRPTLPDGDALLVRVEEIHVATGYRLPVSVKLGAGRVSDDVKIAVKDGFDLIEPGGEKAGPLN